MLGATLSAAIGCDDTSDYSPPDSATATATPDVYDIRVLTQSCRTQDESGEVIVEGTALNVSGESLGGTIARGLFQRDDQSLVLLQDSPVSGDGSEDGGLISFRVAAPDDPAVSRCFVQFVAAGGEPLNVDYSAVRAAPESTPAPSPSASP